jgi:hypothetical protein
VNLAVAVNGTVRATTRTLQVIERRTQDTWSIVLGPDALRAGANSVEIFAVEGSGGSRLLRRAYRSLPAPADATP